MHAELSSAPEELIITWLGRPLRNSYSSQTSPTALWRDRSACAGAPGNWHTPILESKQAEGPATWKNVGILEAFIGMTHQPGKMAVVKHASKFLDRTGHEDNIGGIWRWLVWKIPLNMTTVMHACTLSQRASIVCVRRYSCAL